MSLPSVLTHATRLKPKFKIPLFQPLSPSRKQKKKRRKKPKAVAPSLLTSRPSSPSSPASISLSPQNPNPSSSSFSLGHGAPHLFDGHPPALLDRPHAGVKAKEEKGEGGASHGHPWPLCAGSTADPLFRRPIRHLRLSFPLEALLSQPQPLLLPLCPSKPPLGQETPHLRSTPLLPISTDRLAPSSPAWHMAPPAAPTPPPAWPPRVRSTHPS